MVISTDHYPIFFDQEFYEEDSVFPENYSARPSRRNASHDVFQLNNVLYGESIWALLNTAWKTTFLYVKNYLDNAFRLLSKASWLHFAGKV